MICPKCNGEMMQVAKHDLTIDTCTICGGMWLDKGELGELMKRMRLAESSLDQELLRAQPPRPEHDRAYSYEGDHDRGHYDDHGLHDKYKHRKRSLWDIFD